jgi:hypothetical protein
MKISLLRLGDALVLYCSTLFWIALWRGIRKKENALHFCTALELAGFHKTS